MRRAFPVAETDGAAHQSHAFQGISFLLIFPSRSDLHCVRQWRTIESMTRVIPMAVLEMPEFRSQAAKFMTQEEILEVVTEIARNPEAGDVIPGCGGIRKLRFAASGHGKRGGGRVVYVYLLRGGPRVCFGLLSQKRESRSD
jgi:hypothetical protein